MIDARAPLSVAIGGALSQTNFQRTWLCSIPSQSVAYMPSLMEKTMEHHQMTENHSWVSCGSRAMREGKEQRESGESRRGKNNQYTNY